METILLIAGGLILGVIGLLICMTLLGFLLDNIKVTIGIIILLIIVGLHL